MDSAPNLIPAAPLAATTAQPVAPEEGALRAAAEAFEATFLAQMLDHAGLGRTPGAFGGGSGEGQFASFLVEAQAERLVAAGGIGLADVVFAALRDQEGADDANR
ncbi:MAG: rod-binding protein [Rhodobacteraceae bacterium]|jgi:flagellar protein FlgJ|nr:rod-binding protein [Paracoccaceae bacterium]MBL4556370.1 rod-binding protein [Paracoccaceae bacterium]HBG98194.1 hypothetical protein [Paracoccaceae bacterium]